jgi:hypothetical protein
MQRLLALMTHEIRWLRRSGARELDMILTPDQETRIAMHVVWSRGRFEAQARCHEGDYALINARWHELQYLLDGQGLSLGPLIPPPARVGFSEATGLPLTPALSASATFA